MKITYAITVCNEQFEIIRLVEMILDNKRPQDDIVVLYDQTNGNSEIPDWLTKKSKLPGFQFWRGAFKGHFADWKNKLTEYCSGDYIFQIDADEVPNEYLLDNLHEILDGNEVDVIFIPRVNTVEGLTDSHIQKWGWQVNEKGWVNFPDYQTRIYKNTNDIMWMNKVHERITGYNSVSNFPPQEEYCLYHPKQIKRQEQQNEFYETI